MSNPIYSHRVDTQVVALNKLSEALCKLNPESLRVQLAPRVKKKPIDIGSLAFYRRGKNNDIYDDRGTPVDERSFVESRRELVRCVIESCIGLRDRSILTYFTHVEYFVEWLNKNGYQEIFASLADAQRAYRDYTAELNFEIANNRRKPITAVSFQVAAIRVIEMLYPDGSHYVLAGAVRIISKAGSPPARENHVEIFRNVYLSIAHQCSNFVLSNGIYPCVVDMIGYEVVVFPSHHGVVGPFKKVPLSYNAAERRIATVKEYEASREKRRGSMCYKYNVASSLARTVLAFNAANADSRHWHRYNMANLAAKAYTALFLMITGATPTELSQFTYVDAIEMEKSPLSKELSSVKFRAGGRRTVYNVGRDTGLQLLKDYLKLRAWILNGRSCKLLFFTMPEVNQPKNRVFDFTELDVTACIRKLYDSISGVFLDPKIPRLSPRKMRKYKSVQMHTLGVSLGIVSQSLNHTHAVNLSTYAEATPEQQEKEFGKFWQSIRLAAARVRDRSQVTSPELTSISSGHCRDFNRATPTDEPIPISIPPNCRTQYGCLYCENYVCHSDEEDLHKLLSLQYVVSAVRRRAVDFTHAEVLCKDLSMRITYLIQTLSEQSSSTAILVESMKKKVFEYGELTPFWEARLGRYEKLGVAF
ncbi:hypothetical protein ALP72_03996 [Pseudomonas coronafaciens pv. coronafaciens]|uniref:hypothetical protein n=1 Tax=Pseudomonas coronafaciens TaxID=53409 RepID=UPI000EFFCB4D|nr:hypothetical protein [Pseudomonas coronafaciens]RMS13737.1 hypothetical protein ALP72_03996 [Pseudomonas coronafaciens pv. coronafaciens]